MSTSAFDSTAAKLGFAVGLALVASACSVSVGSTSPEDVAERAIEEGLPEVLGLELSDAACDAPSADEPGETFSCTAQTDGGDTVDIEGIVEPDDEVFVAASNVVIADDMAECPVGPVVLEGDVLTCEISDTSTGERFALIVELTDYVLRAGWDSRRSAVGAPIE
jgi:hypothetical protein